MSFTRPEDSIAQLGSLEGLTVADFGAGTGGYTLPLAKFVGGKGKVYAVDVQKDLLAKLKNTAIGMGLHNIEVLWGDIERSGATKLAHDSVDLVTIANTLFQAEDKIGLVSETKRVLKSGGRVFIVDWRESYGGLGPQPNAVVRQDVARGYFEQEGFVFEKTIDVGAQHYGFVMKK